MIIPLWMNWDCQVKDSVLGSICLPKTVVGKHKMCAFNDSRKGQLVRLNAALLFLPS